MLNYFFLSVFESDTDLLLLPPTFSSFLNQYSSNLFNFILYVYLQ